MLFLFVAAGVLVLAAALALLMHAARDAIDWRSLRARKVMITLTDGPGVSGVAYAHRGRALILKDAVVHGESTQRLDGDLVIFRERILFVQVVN